MTALEQLVQRVRQARAIGLLPVDWGILAEAALAENAGHWESESAFRLRTGTGERWCQRNFARCAKVGLARQNGEGGREWHIHARIPRGADAQDLVKEIRDSMKRGAA